MLRLAGFFDGMSESYAKMNRKQRRATPRIEQGEFYVRVRDILLTLADRLEKMEGGHD